MNADQEPGIPPRRAAVLFSIRVDPRASAARKLGLLDFSAADAGSTDAQLARAAANAGAHWAQIDAPAPLAHVVGVTDIVA